MKKILILLMLFSFALFNSCATVKSEVNGFFTNLFDGKKTGLDTLIYLNGYYHIDSGRIIFNDYFIFFNDGSIANPVDMRKSKFNNKDTVKYILGWGHYYLINDTIKCQVIHPLGALYYSSTFCTERVMTYQVDFKIINKNQIKLINFL